MKKSFLLIVACILYGIIAFAQDPDYPFAPAAAQNIVAAEYFIDNDPGLGNGTSVPVSPAVNISNLSPVINVNGLSNGVHRVFLRTRSAEGHWSTAGWKAFLYDFDPAYPTSPATAQNIVAAEYFIDNDPGTGNATAISITPGVDITNIPVTVNTSGLTNGIHRVYIRTKSNEGIWSLTSLKEFIYNDDPAYPISPAAAQNIVAAEYFVDNDPGFGAATPISVTAATDISNLNVTVNTAGLISGIHRVYVRTKSNEGRWSLINLKDFIVNDDPAYPVSPAAAQNIIAAEYFIDTDPGFGAATAISVSAATNISGLAVTANTAGLANGSHRIYVRTKSNEGKWSLTNQQEFIVNDDPAYPVSPAAAQNIIAAEYFIDNDPGFDAGTPISIAAATDINNLAIAVNTAGLSIGQHTLYIRTKSNEGRWSLTNQRSFFTDMMALSDDTLSFGNVPVTITANRNLTITNNSAVSQTINAVTVTTPFSTNFAGTITIPAGGNHVMQVSFTPSAVQAFEQTMQLQTSAGNYDVVLNGTGITQVASWAISPATGNNYGNVAVSTPSNYTFSILNTGNLSVTLSNVTSSDAAFVPTFTAGTVIPAGGNINLPVVFTPASVGPFNAQIQITSSTAGVTPVTSTVSGNGYNPGAPPVLQFVSGTPYNGNSGVNPVAGQTGNYTYKILYKSSNNRAPQTGYPQLGVDLNGDQDFVDINEGIFTMSKEGSSNDYITGVVYSYTFVHNNNTSTAGYRFFAVDDNGNSAVTVNTNYISGPLITDQQLDLRIFANDITFSKNNPAPGETFTVFARVSNSTALPATNIPIKFYRDTILIAQTTLPAVNAFSNATVSQTLNFAAEGFYPIKVWIDSSNTLGDINPLNNYAIRPVIVGSPVLPGGINVTTTASMQQCPQLRVTFSGHAQYYGNSIPTSVAGAEVTINTGTQLITTTTNSNGDFYYVLTGVTCGGTLTYTVSVTDFTFTSSLVTGSVATPCPAPNACSAPPFMGGISTSSNTNPCAYIAGTNGALNVTVKYRERNIANFWSSYDLIWKDTVKVFHNGTLLETFYTSDDPIFGSLGTFPGDEKTYPVNVDFSTPGPHVITATSNYVYNEMLQLPTYFYHGQFIQMSGTVTNTINVQPNLPDLTIQSFSSTSYTSFNFVNANIKCVSAGAHTVKVYDSIPGGSITLIKTVNASSLAGGAGSTISHSDPGFTTGTHIIKIVTDSEAAVAETDETNNTALFSIIVPPAELTVEKLTASPTALNIGNTTRFTAVVKNTGRTTGNFNVRFSVGGVQVGALKTISALPENSSTTVISDLYTVTTADNSCGPVVEAFADAGNTVSEGNEGNNSLQRTFGADLSPYQLPGEVGSASNPKIVRVFTSNQFFAAVRNIGMRDVKDVTVRFTLNGNWLAADTISNVKTGEIFASYASFTHVFTTAGDYVVRVIADTANSICENDETNNEGNFHIRVVESKADFEVLSQYISPSSLNPNLAQNITLVGTVKNMGGQATTANVLRFFADNIQIGNDVPINALQPGRDTTVAATATYSSIISGVKILKIIADPANTLVEEREDNNLATRAIIVGDAPDMARSHAGAISFNPSGFVAGDSVNVSFIIKNNGTQDGSAWVRFYVKDENFATLEVDSMQYFLASGGTLTVTRKMLFTLAKGFVTTEIDRSNPMEFDLLNNKDTLEFDKVARMKASLVINGNLDMKMGAPAQLPGWIGGKILLGEYDLTVNGIILNYDSAHFIASNGNGKLKLVNSNAENIYPVGPSLTSMNFMRLNNAGTPDNFSVRVADYVLRQGTSGDTMLIVTVDRTWFIEETVPGGSNATVEFWWSVSHEQPGFDRANCRTAHYTSLWELGTTGAAVLATTGQYSKIQANYTSFSPFTVTSGTDITVPLKLLTFTATSKQNDVQLEWRTADETNTSHFEVEFSNDGSHFNKIAQKAAFNTAGNHQYDHLHVAPAGNALYYRIRQVDRDARFVYSRIIKLTRNKLLVVLYPNPAHDFILLKNVAADEVKNIVVVSADGKTAAAWKANDAMQFSISKLAAGMYIISIHKTDGRVEQITFIKD